MSDDVERLARAVRAALDKRGMSVRSEEVVDQLTRGLLAEGVTLSAPAVAPSPTPLQAAAEAVKAEFWKCDTKGGWASGEAEGFARAVLAAFLDAVGKMDRSQWGIHISGEVLAALRALTEEGK